jgi:hypothetical protein
VEAGKIPGEGRFRKADGQSLVPWDELWPVYHSVVKSSINDLLEPSSKKLNKLHFKKRGIFTRKRKVLKEKDELVHLVLKEVHRRLLIGGVLVKDKDERKEKAKEKKSKSTRRKFCC